MKHKGLFLLVLFFLHSVLFSSDINEIFNRMFDELRDKTVFEILQRDYYGKETSIQIIQYINNKEDLDKEVCSKLLLRCKFNDKNYEILINNKEQIITHLIALSLENMLNIKHSFNKNVSGLIIKYINEKKDGDKEPYIKLLVICHPEAVDYGKCIKDNKDEIVNKLNDLPLENILNMRCRLNSNISELIIQYINTIKEEYKEPYVKLLVICNPKAKDYGECINNNKEKIITHLRTLSLADILNIRFRLNKDISELIINHINTIKEEDKEPYIKLLLKCHTEAEGYGDCIKKHAAEIINKLSNLPLENILSNPHLFDQNFSEEIVNYMIKHSNNNKFKKNYNLLLNLNLEGATENTINNYTQLLAKRWKNSKELDIMVNLYNKNKSKNTHSKKDTRDIMYFVLKNKINWGIDFIQVSSTGLIVIGGVGLIASDWSNIEYLEKPAIKNVLKGFCAVGCIGIASVIYHNRKQEQLIDEEINRNSGIMF